MLRLPALLALNFRNVPEQPSPANIQFVRLSLYLTMKRMKLVSFVSSVAAVSVESLTLSTLSEDDALF